MKRSDGCVQAYNAQAAVDADSQVIVARHVTNSARDVEQLVPALEQIRSNTGQQAKELSADAGYFSEDNLKEVSRRRIRGYVKGKRKHGRSSPEPGRNDLKPWGQQMDRRLRQGAIVQVTG